MTEWWPMLMVEMARRCSTAGYKPSAPLLDDAGWQRGYCLDAPDLIPDGVEWWQDPEFDIGGPMVRCLVRA